MAFLKILYPGMRIKRWFFLFAGGVVAAGFSLGMMDVDLVRLSIVLGIVIFFIAIAGLVLGQRIGQRIGARAELAGGAILLLLGIHLLWSTLL